ncbi:MAG: hypothetical protein SGBAC_008951 [Bacillariaceae sp.]
MGMSHSILLNASSMTEQIPQLYQSKQLNAELASLNDDDLDGYDSEFSEDEIEVEDPQWNERLAILKDASNLARLADFFLNPHKPVVATDPFACGRNYFSRASAVPQQSQEETEERELIIKELKQLKQLAEDYLHPERPVESTDPYACGRNYFTRLSAPETVQLQQAEEEAQILEDAAQLKRLAMEHLQPELPVMTSDPNACGRNYFSRPSAPLEEDKETAAERDRILKEARQLKQLAVDYLHPELPVVTTDPFVCGRNHFSRPSAALQEGKETAAERDRILKEARQLKQLAVDYLHPELPVVTTDPFVCGRNYFSRPSAALQEDKETAAERDRILKEARQLKQLAADYLQPELPVVTTDPFVCGRNYFNRPSAIPYAHDDDCEMERVLIMADSKHLKELANEYLCHEVLPVAKTSVKEAVVNPSNAVSSTISDPACVLFVGMNY